MPKYSIIVPVYNAGPYLAPCVQSLLGQTFRDFEILLIDDGSTDGSAALCDAFAEKNSCIRTFHKENSGAASARNFGIDRAVGEYLLFVDCDDTVEPELLTMANQAFARDSSDMLLFGIAFDYYERHDTLHRTEHLGIRHSGFLTRTDFTAQFRALFDDNSLSSACNKIFRTEMIRTHGLRFREDMTMYEDLEFVLRCLGHIRSAFSLAQALYHYRINAATFGHKRVHQLDKLQHNLHCLTHTLLSMDPMPQAAPDIAANLYLQLLMRHLLVSRYKKEELDAVRGFCADEMLRTALAKGAELGSQEAYLLHLIDSGKDAELLALLRKKRLRASIRKHAKQILKRLGLYR